MSAPPPPIWTAAQFRNETNPKAVRKALAAIDYLLFKWQQIQGANSTVTRLEVLSKLSAACTDYLKIKESKKAEKDQKRFGKSSDRLNNRIAKVKQLAKQVFLRMAFERYNYQKVVRAGVAGKLPPAAALAGLKGSYAHERAIFAASKQQGLQGTQTHINPQGASFVHQRMDEHKKGSAAPGAAAPPPAIVAMLDKDFDALTLAEFNALQTHFAQGPQGLGAAPYVHYARKDERLRDLMLVPVDGLLYKSDGQLCDIGWAAYALDRYGNLLVSKANRTWQAGGGAQAMFNHSTLAAGAAVICAGEMRIKKGLIEYISNESGHYKPTAVQLGNAILTLSEEYTLPLIGSIQDVVDVSSGNKVTHNSVLAFLAAHPGMR